MLPYSIKLCSEAFIQKGDDKSIVLDEIMGIAISFIFIKLSIYKATLTFILFRILDIFKPWPISSWESSKLQISISADDILAGIISALIIEFI